MHVERSGGRHSVTSSTPWAFHSFPQQHGSLQLPTLLLLFLPVAPPLRPPVHPPPRRSSTPLRHHTPPRLLHHPIRPRIQPRPETIPRGLPSLVGSLPPSSSSLASLRRIVGSGASSGSLSYSTSSSLAAIDLPKP
ncbi:hypothetical protein C4D60_Mb06t35180 [Musa balbisiana]|uniref:Uncharacterized protein n=1 Tax=Musa balbisiana TaxID=52838 RepID=A0A4S8ISX6_MUSBA|nr:hypothetical protein C4D60_Mb06t35180 [Musa balbisiana]